MSGNIGVVDENQSKDKTGSFYNTIQDNILMEITKNKIITAG